MNQLGDVDGEASVWSQSGVADTVDVTAFPYEECMATLTEEGAGCSEVWLELIEASTEFKTLDATEVWGPLTGCITKSWIAFPASSSLLPEPSMLTWGEPSVSWGLCPSCIPPKAPCSSTVPRETFDSINVLSSFPELLSNSSLGILTSTPSSKPKTELSTVWGEPFSPKCTSSNSLVRLICSSTSCTSSSSSELSQKHFD